MRGLRIYCGSRFLAVFFSVCFAAAGPLWGAVKAPDFSGKDVYGKEHKAEDYKGKTKVLYFWATWCPGCVQDTANINKLYETYSIRGVEFISVSLDKDAERLKKYIEKNSIRFPVLFSGESWDQPLVQEFSVNSTPTFFIISPDQEIWGSGHWSRELENWLGRLEAPQ